MTAAAEVAAAALLDTLRAAVATVGPDRCHLALAGDLGEAVRGEELLRAVAGWTVHPQVGDGFAARLARAHADVGGLTQEPVVQVGMDTPQVTPALLRGVAADLAGADAVLGEAQDGGWWVLGLRDPAAAACLVEVPMSTPRTGTLTRAALEATGLRVATTRVLRDVDTVADAEAVADECPGSAFAEAWRRVVHEGAGAVRP
ncbi:DUF2064 domain-containing protein [Nocardioides sp. GY 10127]|nr:DUF2064 domain-containing protein [Nocardioides sp. GY 10127]